MTHQAKLGRTTVAALSATLLATCCSFASIPLPEHPRPDWERSDWKPAGTGPAKLLKSFATFLPTDDTP